MRPGGSSTPPRHRRASSLCTLMVTSTTTYAPPHMLRDTTQLTGYTPTRVAHNLRDHRRG
ncbi:hypothetical protein PF005_g17969 [Phytophthora fragariae]|uniref:Uncharacterized protein n=1 Tax=Phytophthora fragariae TaxID=53985 RepID=A0A6A4C1A0_9STRA|nr:hypothetical protein PF003_g28004 [Phytophthora fragariae]KAE8924954.1 hypothetical protein PF009_g24824 [Phytophthora fragariae]KAE8977909.1 hypothetical protein PF011_g23462 [Phytophthora fragariae]KAE9093703.1 hypothetical protein PF010_g17387 [Phytophthora fragariae]KAE9093779.1 hypothetical protein PF007_g18000 [Phytophthora fragariae]